MASLSLGHESDEADAVEWPQDGEGDLEMLTPGDENITPGVNPAKAIDPPTGEKVSPVKPRVLFGNLTAKEQIAADKAGLAVGEQGSLAVSSPGGTSPLPPLHLVHTKAQRTAKAKAKSQAQPGADPPPASETVQQPKKKGGWPKGKAKACMKKPGAVMKRPAAAMKKPSAASKPVCEEDSTLLQL